MSIALAVLSALGFGIGMTLQQRAARTLAFSEALGHRTLSHLLRRRIWLLGLAASGAGFLLQLAALRSGDLAVVQPIVTTALVVCLAVTARLDGVPLGRSRWAAVGVVIAGLAIFVRSGSTRGEGSATGAAWAVYGCALLAVVVGCVAVARRDSSRWRPFATGLAAGIGNAAVGALGHSMMALTHDGLWAVLTSAYPYVLAVAAVVTVVLVQAIYQAGTPTVSLPLATVAENLVSVGLAILLFHEASALTGSRRATALIGLGLALVALGVLGRAEARLTIEAAPHAPS
jgi:drug/metabolite transporter (DMT)-like permease